MWLILDHNNLLIGELWAVNWTHWGLPLDISGLNTLSSGDAFSLC